MYHTAVLTAQGDGASIPGTWVMGAVARGISATAFTSSVASEWTAAASDGQKLQSRVDLRGPRAALTRTPSAARAAVARLADRAVPGDGESAAPVSLFCNVHANGAKVWRFGVRSKLFRGRSLGTRATASDPEDAHPAMLLAGRAFIAEIRESVERNWRKQPLSRQHRVLEDRTADRACHGPGRVPGRGPAAVLGVGQFGSGLMRDGSRSRYGTGKRNQDRETGEADMRPRKRTARA